MVTLSSIEDKDIILFLKDCSTIGKHICSSLMGHMRARNARIMTQSQNIWDFETKSQNINEVSNKCFHNKTISKVVFIKNLGISGNALKTDPKKVQEILSNCGNHSGKRHKTIFKEHPTSKSFTRPSLSANPCVTCRALLNFPWTLL